MKTTFFNFLFFISILVSTVTCKHKCESDPDAAVCPGCKQDQSLDGMKDYFFFKTGTWWVYQEQNSGELDTVTVFFDFEGLSGGFPSFQWKASSTYFEYNFYHTYNESFSSDCLNDKDCLCKKLLREKSRPGDYIGGGRYFTYPLFEGNYTNFDAVCKVETIYENYELNDLSFHDVALVDIPIDLSTTNTGQHTKYWFAKNVGIVEHKNISNDQHWMLIDYSIIQ